VDKYIKQIQTRMNRQLKSREQSVTKQQVRDVYSVVVKDSDKPTDVEMSVVTEKLAQQISLQDSQQETLDNGQLTVSADTKIEKPEIIEITPEENPDIWETLEPKVEQPSEETSAITTPIISQELINRESTLAKSQRESTLAKSQSDLPTQQTEGISQVKMTQAIAQAVQQVGASNNAEAVQLLTSLANELSADISDVQEMAATLVAAYLNKRQSVLSTAISTLNTLRSAQTESFQAGLDQDFFGQKQKNKKAFLSSLSAMFN
jgi:hypothetical protein